MALNPFHVSQTIFRQPQPHILVVPVLESDVATALNAFVQTITNDTIGISAAYAEKCRLAALALASDSHVLVVRFPATSKSKGKKGKGSFVTMPPGRKALHDLILRHDTMKKLGWNLDRVVASLYYDYHLLMTNGADMSTLGPSKKGKSALDALITSVGGPDVLTDNARLPEVFGSEKFDPNKLDKLALRAWAAFHAGTKAAAALQLAKASLYDTTTITEEVGLKRHEYEALDADETYRSLLYLPNLSGIMIDWMRLSQRCRRTTYLQSTVSARDPSPWNSLASRLVYANLPIRYNFPDVPGLHVY